MRSVAAAVLVWIVVSAVSVGHPFRGATVAAQSNLPAKAPSNLPAKAPSNLPAKAGSYGTAVTHRAWLDKYCVGCHNTRSPQPPTDPLNLETASLYNVLPHAATWERVLRKLAARAMPPQGMPHPAEAEYVAFTTWLSGSLDRAWAARNTPGRYVVPPPKAEEMYAPETFGRGAGDRVVVR